MEANRKPPSTMTADEARSLPVTVDLPTAGRALGVGRDAAYRLARSGRFPLPVIRAGKKYRVTRAAILGALGIHDQPAPGVPDPGNPLAEATSPQVSAVPTDSETAGK